MISGLKIGNFKAFGPAQEIPLRPITLVFGPNSAGKSSIIQALLLARHIQDTANVDAHQTTLGGAAVDLGGFARFVHGHDEGREVTIHFSIKRTDLRGKFHDLDQFETLTLAYAIGCMGISKIITSVTILLDGLDLRQLTRTEDGTFQMEKVPIIDANPLALHDSSKKEVHAVAEALLAVAPQEILKLAEKLGLSASDVIDQNRGKPTILGCLKMAERLSPDRSALIEELASAKFKIEGLALKILNPLPRTGFYNTDDMHVEEHDADSDPRAFFAYLVTVDGSGLDYTTARERMYEMSEIPDEERDAKQCPGETPKSRAKAIRYMVEYLIEAANEAIANGLSAMSYLGPLRWIPPRLIPDGDQFDASWTAGGGDAWQRLRREPELLERVNHFLRGNLRTRYRLECQHFARVRSAVASTGNSPSDPLSARIAEDPPPAAARRVPSADETIATLSIVDADTGLTVSHRDVGTGISQLLPVLVNAAGSKERLIAIEQPELHLHPALQAELGDVFIESALGPNKNTFLIETHSEHLIRRIMRRIRESNAGRQPAHLPRVRPEDVAILFVQPTESGAVVKHLRVDQQGRLKDDWPGGFFEEAFNELF